MKTQTFDSKNSLSNLLQSSFLLPVLGILLLLPFVYLLYLQLSGANHDIAFNQRESQGVQYITPVQDFLLGVQERGNLRVGQLHGQTVKADELSRLDAAIDEASRQADAAEQQYGKELTTASGESLTGARWQQIRAKWQSLKGASFSNAAECSAAHLALANDARDFILNYLANYSNLILDPDLDSYWLMDSFVARVPDMTMAIQELGDIVSTAAHDGEISSTDRYRTAALEEKVRGLARDFMTNLDVSYQNNPAGNVRPAIEGVSTSATNTITAYLDAIRNQVLLPNALAPTLASSTLLRDHHSVRTAVAETLHAIGPVLDQLCLTRVSGYEKDKNLGMVAGVACALLMAYVLFSQFQVTRARRQISETLAITQDLREKAETENSELQSNIMALLTVVSDVADGDLTRRVAVTEGALGNVADALNQMLESWADVLTEARHAIEETNLATQKITDVSRKVSEGAFAQVEMLNTVDSTVQDIMHRIQKVNENASTAAQAASRTQESAVSGAETVTSVVEGMEGLRINVQAGARKIKNLGERSMEISSIVATIAKISEQTNMLALNAAIEAARAGEQGRGFTVVADEVRKLAERTASATEDISKLVTGIQAETAESVLAIDEQTRAVEEEAQIVSRTGDALLKIQGESTQSAALIGDISSTAKAQVEVANQAVASVAKVSRIAQDAATSSAENLRLAQGLNQSAKKLSDSMSRFKLART